MIVFLLTGCALPSLSGAGSSDSDADVQTLTSLAMGTTLTATFYTDASISSTDDNTGEYTGEKVTSLLTDLENDVLSWRVETSEIGQINAEAAVSCVAGSGQYSESDAGSESDTDSVYDSGSETDSDLAYDSGSETDSDSTCDTYYETEPEVYEITLSDTLASYLTEILDVSLNSGGALDPTVGLLSQLWDIGGSNPRIPSEDEIAAVLPFTGYERLSLSGNLLSVPAGMALDLGAVGKGIGCDAVGELLEAEDTVTAAVVSIGGSILTWGTKPDGTDWSVAIRDPRDEDGYLGILKVTGTCYISTSGDYEKYFIEDGTRYCHILDPETGYPADSGLISVTVVCDSGLLSDALSTACFVLGYEDSLSLLSLYGAEAIFVDEDKNVYVTDGLADIFTLSADEYTLPES
ncbi:MAG: FAD:protein FMN transferase [Lachnospiraceae bacterium]|nr:FAD:protein FMN transferase [Lachnospiraceae bacterium]